MLKHTPIRKVINLFCFLCFTEPSQVLRTILKDVEEEFHFTKIDKEKDELLHKEKIEAKQHAKRMTQISKDREDNLNIALKAFIESHATVRCPPVSALFFGTWISSFSAPHANNTSSIMKKYCPFRHPIFPFRHQFRSFRHQLQPFRHQLQPFRHPISIYRFIHVNLLSALLHRQAAHHHYSVSISVTRASFAVFAYLMALKCV